MNTNQQLNDTIAFWRAARAIAHNADIPYDPKLHGDTREAYLAWRQQWRTAYAALSRSIREAKQTRPVYKWVRNPKATGNAPDKRWIKDGLNPTHHRESAPMLSQLQEAARRALEDRQNAKVTANALRNARLAVAA